MHIHCEKAEKEAKFWLDSASRRITVAFAFNLSPRDLRIVRGVIKEYFNEIEKAWIEVQKRKGL